MNVTTAQTVANTNEINPETISIAAAVLGMLLIALVGVGGFTVLAQRRLRAIGMLAAQGATQRHIRLVVRANGAATGIVGAVAGAVLGFLAWLAYRPQAENGAHHVMGVFQLPWAVIGISMALAIIATYFAASRPAKAIARVPVVAALAGRPPAPRKTRHLAVPVGLCFLVGAFLLLGAAGATTGSGGGKSNQTLELAVGFIALTVAIVLLAPALLSVVAAAGRRSPIAVRLALRDLARYRARSGPALAAISLSTLIAVIICVASAARFGNVLDYTGPNLTSSQLIVYAPGDAAGFSSGPNGQPTNGADRRRAKGREGHRRRARHGQHDHARADQREPEPRRERALMERPDLRGDAAAAQRVRHQAVRDQPGRRHPDDASGTVDDEPDAAHLRRPAWGRADRQPGQRAYQRQPVALPGGQLHRQPAHPGGRPAPVRHVRAEHGGHRARDHHPAPAEVGRDLRLAHPGAERPHRRPGNATPSGPPRRAGMSVETRNSIPSLAQIIDAATLFGIVLAIGILGLSVGLVRSEAARDLRTLSATGAGGGMRRTITATTAGALAFTGAVVGIVGGYLAAIGFFRSNSLDGLSSLTSIPVTNLLVILVGMPLAATVLGWLLAGRDPGGIARQPLE